MGICKKQKEEFFLNQIEKLNKDHEGNPFNALIIENLLDAYSQCMELQMHNNWGKGSFKTFCSCIKLMGFIYDNESLYEDNKISERLYQAIGSCANLMRHLNKNLGFRSIEVEEYISWLVEYKKLTNLLDVSYGESPIKYNSFISCHIELAERMIKENLNKKAFKQLIEAKDLLDEISILYKKNHEDFYKTQKDTIHYKHFLDIDIERRNFIFHIEDRAKVMYLMAKVDPKNRANLYVKALDELEILRFFPRTTSSIEVLSNIYKYFSSLATINGFLESEKYRHNYIDVMNSLERRDFRFMPEYDREKMLSLINKQVILEKETVMKDRIYGEINKVGVMTIDGERIDISIVPADIGLTYTQLKEKSCNENKKALSGEGFSRMKMVYMSDDKVVESYIGYGYVNGKFTGKADKLICVLLPDENVSAGQDAVSRFFWEMTDGSKARILEIWNNDRFIKIDFSKASPDMINTAANNVPKKLEQALELLYDSGILDNMFIKEYHSMLKTIIEEAGGIFTEN